MDYLGGQSNRKGPFRWKRGRTGRSEAAVMMENGQRDVTLLALKVDEGNTRPGMWMSSRIWKTQESDISPGASRRNTALTTP